MEVVGREEDVEGAQCAGPELADDGEHGQRDEEPAAPEEADACGELPQQAAGLSGGPAVGLLGSGRSAVRPDRADHDVGDRVRQCVQEQRPLEAGGEEQRRGEGRPDDPGGLTGGLGDACRPGTVGLPGHQITDDREACRSEELARRVERQDGRVDDRQPDPDREGVDRQEGQGGQHGHQPAADHLGAEHRATFVPAVDEHARERTDDQDGDARRQQDPADRHRGPALVLRQHGGHPQHQGGAEDGVPDGRDRLPEPEPRVVAVDEYQTWGHDVLPDETIRAIRAVTRVVW